MSPELSPKDRLVGMFLGAIDGRDPRPYILGMDGDECVDAHNLMKKLDELLKRQWNLMGAPEDRDIL